MTTAPIHSSRPHHSVSPRPTRDPRKNGPLQPMTPERGGWLRFFRRK